MVMAQTACYLTRFYDFYGFLNAKEKLHVKNNDNEWLYEITASPFKTCTEIRPSQQPQKLISIDFRVIYFSLKITNNFHQLKINENKIKA